MTTWDALQTNLCGSFDASRPDGLCIERQHGRFSRPEDVLALVLLGAVDVAVVLAALARQVLDVDRLEGPLRLGPMGCL